jgi:hypothetical protein
MGKYHLESKQNKTKSVIGPLKKLVYREGRDWSITICVVRKYVKLAHEKEARIGTAKVHLKTTVCDSRKGLQYVWYDVSMVT